MSSRAGMLVLLCAVLLLPACDRGGPAEDPFPARSPGAEASGSEGPVIGLVGTMSGPSSWRGEDAFEGADLAVHVLNASLARDDPPYQLVTLDDRGDPSTATEHIEELASSDRTRGIVYAGPPEALTHVEPALAAAGIPAILCFGDLHARDALTPHLFQVAPPQEWQARRIAAYLVNDRRLRRVGMVGDDSTEGRTAASSLRAALRTLPRRSSLTVATYGDEDDLGRALASLRRRRVEAVVVQGSPTSFSAVLRSQARTGSRYRTTAAARTVSASNPQRRNAPPTAPWHPQVVAFESAISPVVRAALPPGTVAADTYARGAHYLPVPSLAAFRSAFEDWWGDEPLGWERRAFEATSMIGWAVERAGEGDDLAKQLERMKSQRFGGLDVTFGPADHVATEPSAVGLWTIPRPGLQVLERNSLPDSMPWVPLGRGFSSDGRHTDIDPDDWRYLFTVVPTSSGPGPLIGTSRWGITTPRSDPVH